MYVQAYSACQGFQCDNGRRLQSPVVQKTGCFQKAQLKQSLLTLPCVPSSCNNRVMVELLYNGLLTLLNALGTELLICGMHELVANVDCSYLVFLEVIILPYYLHKEEGRVRSDH